MVVDTREQQAIKYAVPADPGSPEERLVHVGRGGAAALGISWAFDYEAVNCDEIRHARIGKRILIPRAALERILEAGPRLASR